MTIEFTTKTPRAQRTPSFLCVTLCSLCLCGSLFAEIVDRIVASAGTRVVTLSDVREAYAVQSMLDRKPMAALDEQLIRNTAERLIDQLLIQQEMESTRMAPTSEAERDRRRAEIISNLGGEAAFRRALADYGLEAARFWAVLDQQMNAFQFIDLRFRFQAADDEQAIERYYREKLAPKLREQGAPVPELSAVRDQIAQIVAQEQINQDYAAWIKELRSQVTVRFR
jgi:hypothetical protein